jgi:chromatin remodeling complex protein RSC6
MTNLVGQLLTALLGTGCSLQDPKDKRNVRADEKLLAVFDGKKVVSMFEMTKLVNGHLV